MNNDAFSALNEAEAEEAATFALAALGAGKHDLDFSDCEDALSTKRARTDSVFFSDDAMAPIPYVPDPVAYMNTPLQPDLLEPQQFQQQQQQQQIVDPTVEGLKPFPFYHYTDYSTTPDPDPFVPRTAPGRVPNFPAKMHAILSRPDLADIICWMPHGRSWKVLKPREFECRVIPKYFEHAKFSSFIRQANGWGFRRITTGHDRNSYYHPRFLRGLPHLCKLMKRPGVSEKVATDPENEPDLYKISEMFPVPLEAEDDNILLPCTIQGGPKARMPIQSIISKYAPTPAAVTSSSAAPPQTNLMPRDQEAIKGFQESLTGITKAESMQNHQQMAVPVPLPVPAQPMVPQTNAFMPNMALSNTNPLAAANQMAFPAGFDPTAQNQLAFQAQFAAGFAAAMSQTFFAQMQAQAHQPHGN